MMRRTKTTSAGETATLGSELAARLTAGDVVLVCGELGSGKTTFVRGACRALGVSSPVTSPTFTLGQRYRGRTPVSHLDLYRVEQLEGEDPALLSDYLTSDAISFVEWPQGGEDAFAAIARVAYRVELSHAGDNNRVVEIVDGG